MKKSIKIILTILVFVILFKICSITYAKYKSIGTGTLTPTAANWVININNSNVVSTNLYTFTSSQLVWNNNVSGAKTGTIAPGSTATITININATGTEVPVDYEVVIYDIIAIYNGTIEPGDPTVVIGDPVIGGGDPDPDPDSNPDPEPSQPDINDLITIVPATGYSLTGTIAQSNSMTRTIVLNLTWDDLNTLSSNEKDTLFSNYSLTIPIEVITKQHIG